jgi:hypothetical protein
MDDLWFPIDDYDSNIRDAECEGDDEQEYPSDDGEYDEPIAPTPQITEESIKRKHDEDDDDNDDKNPFKKNQEIDPDEGETDDDDEEDSQNPFKKNQKYYDTIVGRRTQSFISKDPDDRETDDDDEGEPINIPYTTKNPFSKEKPKKKRKIIDNTEEDAEVAKLTIPATKECVDHNGLEIMPLFEQRHIYDSKV